MTDDDFPHGLSEELESAALRPLDAVDDRLLAEVGQLLTEADPVPADLVDRIRFSLALDEMYAEVAQLSRMPLDSVAVRGDQAAGMRTETLTFSAERLTAMVTVTRPAPDRIRVDGWLAPPGVMRVHLRMQEGSQDAIADESGRFVFEGLPEGFAQLAFHSHPDRGDDDPVVVTPLFQL